MSATAEPSRGEGRREFVVALAGLGASLAARAAGAQQAQPAQQNFAPMAQDAYRPVLRAAKDGAPPSMTDDARDALEHRLKCQCGCVLDVYTCRTTDFTCSVSPAMHRDVMRLVAGGYDAEEIIAAFVQAYGEVVLTAPVKQGFNWAGYLAPGIALATGGVVLTMMLRRWAANARAASAAAGAPAHAPIAGLSADDAQRLERALREDA